MSAETERIEALEEALARLTGDRDRQKAAEQAKLDNFEGKDRPEPSGFVGELLRLQELERQARAKAHEDHSRRYEEQVAANAPKRAKLVTQLEEVGKGRQAENDRYAAALARIADEERKVEQRIVELDRPPAMIEPDLTAAHAAAREMAMGTVNGIPIVMPRRKARSPLGF
jgi:hypothetical protein